MLTIDHSPELLTLLRELLEEESFQVTTQSQLDHNLASIAAIKPDLITLVYHWSADDRPWSLLQLLNMDRRTVHIPIVFCTGAVREAEALQRHLEAMDVAVVLKPFDIDRLARVIHESLAKASARRRQPASIVD